MKAQAKKKGIDWSGCDVVEVISGKDFVQFRHL